MLRIAALVIASLALVPLAARPSHESAPAAAVGDIVRLDADVSAAIAQGDTEGCGPVSLLNLLKLGPSAHRAAYATISGGDDRKALRSLAKKYCSPTGDMGKVRYSDENGIDDPNLTKLCERIAADYKLPPIDTLYATRNKDESDADLAGRVNDAMIAALSRGVPVVLSIDSYGVKDGKWRKLTGHYVLLTGAQRLSRSNTRSFLIEYVDPVGARHRQAFVYAGGRDHDGAYAHRPGRDEWLKNDPYLCMSVPYADLNRSSLGRAARHEFFLTIIFGRFAH